MKALKTGFLATLTAGVLLGISSGVMALGASAAESPIAQPAASGLANVACAPSGGAWTDCTLTLTSGIGAGASVVASLPSQAGTVAFCDDGAPLNSTCGIDGNAAAFTCWTGCGAGTQFVTSVLGAPAAAVGNLAHQFSVSGSGGVGLIPRDPVLSSASTTNGQ